MLSKNLSQLIFLSVFSIVVLSCLGCGEEEADSGYTSGEWSLQDKSIEDGCGVYQSTLEELTAGESATRTLTFSAGYSSVTVTEGTESLECPLTDGSVTCNLTDEMVAGFTEAQLIRTDEPDGIYSGSIIARNVIIGGTLSSSTAGELTIELAVTCEGEVDRCPPRVNMSGFGIIDLPCSSTVKTPIVFP